MAVSFSFNLDRSASTSAFRREISVELSVRALSASFFNSSRSSRTLRNCSFRWFISSLHIKADQRFHNQMWCFPMSSTYTVDGSFSPPRPDLAASSCSSRYRFSWFICFSDCLNLSTSSDSDVRSPLI